MVAKALTRVHIADVQLDQRNARALDGIEQRHAGVGVGPGIEHHARQFARSVHATGLVNPVHQRALVVALVKAQRKPVAGTGGGAQLLYIGECLGAIHSGFTGTQQVEVGAIQDKNGFHRHALRAIRLPHRQARRRIMRCPPARLQPDMTHRKRRVSDPSGRHDRPDHHGRGAHDGARDRGSNGPVAARSSPEGRNTRAGAVRNTPVAAAGNK